MELKTWSKTFTDTRQKHGLVAASYLFAQPKCITILALVDGNAASSPGRLRTIWRSFCSPACPHKQCEECDEMALSFTFLL
eukprot:6442574-Amphidinium_carterae.1